MKRIKWCVLLALSAGLGVACGGSDDKGENEGPVGGSGGGQGAGGAEPAPEGSVPCGSQNCVTPEGVTGEPCCKDQFASKCGVMSQSFMGMACGNPPKPVDPSCTDTFMRGPVTLGACCTDTGVCGVDTSTFGGDCSDWASFAEQAMGFGMITVEIPPEKTCTGS
jgi:hypothetical protein